MLKKAVSEELGRLTGEVASASVADVLEAHELLRTAADPRLSSWLREPLGQRATAIALMLAGREPGESLRVHQLGPARGGGYSLEAEFTTPMAHPDVTADGDYFRIYGRTIARGPQGARVILELKKLYRGPGGMLYRVEQEAIDAGGPGDVEVVVIPEVIPGVMSDDPEEGRPGRAEGFGIVAATQRALDGIPGEPGGPATVPIESVLTEEVGWALEPGAAGWKMGPRPVGAPRGAHNHYNVGVPLAVLHPFMRHVLRRTWRDRSEGYFTRDHLADALGFADDIAARFVAQRFLGYVPSDLAAARAVLDAIPDRAVQELRGHAAALYVEGAMLVNSRLGPELNKAHAAVLVRQDPDQRLASLPQSASGYLADEDAQEDFLDKFQARLRSRIPDLDARYYQANELPDDGFVDVFDLLPSAANMGSGHTVGNFLLSGLVPEAELGMITRLNHVTQIHLFEADHAGGLPKVVAEVRSYGQRTTGAGESSSNLGVLAHLVDDELMPKANRLHHPRAGGPEGIRPGEE